MRQYNCAKSSKNIVNIDKNARFNILSIEKIVNLVYIYLKVINSKKPLKTFNYGKFHHYPAIKTGSQTIDSFMLDESVSGRKRQDRCVT